MSWYDDILTAAAGQLKAILDAKLPLNSHWHIEDAGAGANIGVYHCLDAAENVDFIVVISDNQADYASVALWAGWDSGTHTGTGASWSSATEYTINKIAGAYGLSVLDHRFIYVTKEPAQVDFFYVGQPLRFDVTKDMPMMIARDTATSGYGAGIAGPIAGGRYWLALRDEDGAKRSVAPTWYQTDSNKGFACALTSDGRYLIRETPVWNLTSLKLIGLLEGVCGLGAVDYCGLANLDTVTDEDANVWLALCGPTSALRGVALVRKS